ncbi:MAG TPA: WD40 repeat domain-containing protein [Candidatus Odoribacter faecigallinarum]|uniref:WD40 repeat domain-containing protein n=1 Tax=Candidatus Odoribacter faecigallinarum TaxID=2838706 RepID=A0A9D2AAK0_9BACT|nr:WD40 repeat domain-containing protein [Candidatus Odoribacter faecigallinarum]
MKKGIWLSVGAVALIGIIGFGIWFINAKKEIQSEDKNLFIPYNSAFVVTVHGQLAVPEQMEEAVVEGGGLWGSGLLEQVVDSLRTVASISAYPYVLASRVEGKGDVTFLYALDNTNVWARGEVVAYLTRLFSDNKEQVRKYDRFRIYTLAKGKERVYFTVCGGIVLVSDSDLYIEDGLKQFDLESAGKEVAGRLKDVSKYFSAGADVNVLINTELFTDWLPLFLRAGKWFPHLDVRQLFKWGTLDGDFSEKGIFLNGFLAYEGLDKSYARTLAGQRPGVVSVDKVAPACLVSLGLLNLDRLPDYFSALEDYRYSTGRKGEVFNRKQQYAKMFGKTSEEEWRNLLQGEFACIGLPSGEGETEGLVVALLKSGSLGQGLLGKMMSHYAGYAGKPLKDYERQYAVDKEKSFTYYEFPAKDYPVICWGEWFDGMESGYAFVEGNCLVFATSRDAVEMFLEDYVHGSFVRDAEWYQHLQGKLAGKCNLAYFACTEDFLASRREVMQGRARDFIKRQEKLVSLLPSFAFQWSNEGEMLYNTFYFSMEPLKRDARPHVLWRTRLEAPMTMKPVAVVNHVTGEQEMFVQDSSCRVYLVNDAGRVLWTYPLEEAINSEVYQVDLYKNGKLQYLFSTASKIYLIDRNGNAAGNFPLTLRAKCTQGISVYDYDGNRDYRIFAPAEDQRVYLYDLNGKVVQGWMPARADKPIVTPVRHFRVEDKDYLVFADRYRLYILDRRGKERVKVTSVFDLPVSTDIRLVQWKGQPRLALAGKEGTVYLVAFDGRVETVLLAGMPESWSMNVSDVNADGNEECIATGGSRLAVYTLEGKLLWEKQFDGADLGYPYAYRFSASDIRIGLVDTVQSRLWLLSGTGEVSKGFPVSGDSPFSIVFAGREGFFLFAGADKGAFIKYKVQR